ncbi:EF-P lysine aminoacylase EpmA [Telmatospirillum sp. J64-1]|uniref:EF-P lysine aminoacylase EpmA n=1 Tax=Telmatospirillum sp. J64-1 TaxID=2502183 RepID=UPI00115E3B98|nr:EF-P lysine aminoacylase EpmA [Telmatospirillum sp. J64-1]
MSGKAWWDKQAFAARLPYLRGRMAVVEAVRAFFRERGFFEVETPALQVSPGMEPHIMALETRLDEPFGQDSRRMYLHTSPEFAMKKLLAAGAGDIFQIARVWRNGERSPTHQPEFTMLEWYRTGASYRDLMEDCEGLIRACARAAGATVFRRNGMECDPFRPFRRLTVPQAFLDYAGIDLLATAPDPWAPDADALRTEAARIGVRVGEGDSWEDCFFHIMLDRIEPHLGEGVPTILCDYPVSMAALSRPSSGDPRVAERFELYACGVELANAFSELTDPAEQRRRFEADMDLKERLYGLRYPIDEDFLAALEVMPDSAGIALGLDRLAMLCTGAKTIEDVLWIGL